VRGDVHRHGLRLLVYACYQQQVLLTQVPIYAAYLYDAVNVYARALKEALDDGIKPENGSAIVDRIKGRTYDSKSFMFLSHRVSLTN